MTTQTFGGAAARGALPQKTVSQVLGEITWLLSQSPLHKNMFIADLEWMVMPAILLEQFRLFHRADGQPAGLVIWGSVSDETEERLRNHQVRLRPDDWKGGLNLWLIEMVAPFGGQEEMLADCAGTIFRGLPFKYHITGPNGAEVKTYAPETN